MRTLLLISTGLLVIFLLLSAGGASVTAQRPDPFAKRQVENSLQPLPASKPPDSPTAPSPAHTNISALTVADYILDPQGIPADKLSTEVTPATLWKWQHGAHQLHAVHFINTSRGWAVGDWGLIVHTDDGGQSWERQESGVSNWLGNVQFVDANTGWAIGSAGTILHTTDGGLTWNVQSSPLAVGLRELSFVDSQRGWIGLPDGVLKTTDGGNTWVKTGTGVAAQVRDMQFFDADNGILISSSGDPGDGFILLTSDGGVTWTPADCPPWGKDNFRALHFPTRDFGVAVGGWVNPIIYMTNDSGASWTKIETAITFAVPDSVYFVDTDNGWAVDGSTHLRTTDGGLTWAKLSGASANDVHFVTTNKGFVAGYSGVSLSTDGGYTWSRPDCFDDSALRGVSFVNSTEGWAVGDGKILHTADSGQTWEVQRDDDSYLRAVHFASRLHGWAVGNNGKILATTNGGSTWTIQTAGTSYILYDVDFVDDSYGWIAGAEDSFYGDGRVWRTTDGGAHWTQAGYFSGWDNYGKYDIDFVDRNVGYVAGVEGEWGSVHKTTDGGETWIEKSLGGDYPVLRGLDFISANEGWVVGDDGFIAQTTNGGDSWELQASGVGDDLYAVAFLNSQRGYAVGGYYYYSGDVVLMTTDGGLTWVEESTVPSQTVYDVSFPDRYHAWIVGNSGMIRAYTDPNIPEMISIFLPAVMRN